uniref:Uncharacterized protein n=1 Tax=Aegilops tauschii subsp. strangulata TaxID=200361 RepID=A0A453MYS8_AEGTS
GVLTYKYVFFAAKRINMLPSLFHQIGLLIASAKARTLRAYAPRAKIATPLCSIFVKHRNQMVPDNCSCFARFHLICPVSLYSQCLAARSHICTHLARGHRVKCLCQSAGYQPRC